MLIIPPLTPAILNVTTAPHSGVVSVLVSEIFFKKSKNLKFMSGYYDC